MAKKWPPKDPNEDLDYTINWGDRVGTSDPIIASEWGITTPQPAATSPDTNLAKHTETIEDGSITADGAASGVGTEGATVTDGATRVWLTGGTLGETYELVNRITTFGGRIMDQTMKIQIKTK